MITILTVSKWVDTTFKIFPPGFVESPPCCHCSCPLLGRDDHLDRSTHTHTHKNLKFVRKFLAIFSGRHPKLLHCNVYVTMFYKVLNSFFFFLLWYSLFLIAFGMGFYIMLHDDSVVKHGLDEDDKNKYFNRTWTSLVKTSAMFVGELEFSDLPMNTNTYLGMLAYTFFLAFIFLIVVVLMNLLNGLAVSDTNDIKEKAEIYSYISRVETISYMESVLLGDPFDFLSNVPAYLASLPSGSLLRQMYRNPCCRKVVLSKIYVFHFPTSR